MSKPSKLPNGTEVLTNNSFEADMLIAEIFEHSIYQDGNIRYSEGDTILDIGGNVGLFAHFASQQCDGLLVISCEPIPDIHGLLCKNTESISNAEIKPLLIGIASSSDPLRFRYTPRFPCASTAFPDLSDGKFDRDVEFTLGTFEQLSSPTLRHTLQILPLPIRRLIANWSTRYYNKSIDIECQMTTISDLIDRFDLDRVALIKMDIEGAEVDALKGIRDEHWDRLEQFCIETHFGDEIFEAVHRVLCDHGYDVTYRQNPVAPADRMVYAVKNCTAT